MEFRALVGSVTHAKCTVLHIPDLFDEFVVYSAYSCFMTVTSSSPKRPTQGGGTSLAAFLAAGLVWLVVGVLVRHFLFPETIEKVVTQAIDRVVT